MRFGLVAITATLLGCGGKVVVDPFCEDDLSEIASRGQVETFCTCQCEFRARHEGCDVTVEHCVSVCQDAMDLTVIGTGCEKAHMVAAACLTKNMIPSACAVDPSVVCHDEVTACRACCPSGTCCP